MKNDILFKIFGFPAPVTTNQNELFNSLFCGWILNDPFVRF